VINNTDNQNYIRTTEQFKDQQMKDNSEKDALGRDAFLTLFTTQLKNQSPLDPMGNEAFVAQLAQFSQVEGIKGMQGSMEELVSTVKAEQMFAGSNLVGKRVAITGGVVSGGDGAQSEGIIDLPGGAKGIAWAVYDQATDTPIFRSTLGPQAPGELSLIWNGTDLNGGQTPQGNYIIKANIVEDDRLQAIPVTTFVDVKSVSWRPDTQKIELEVGGGAVVTMEEIGKITN
jgi:flagellar basal-body rod modification protein FlgD